MKSTNRKLINALMYLSVSVITAQTPQEIKTLQNEIALEFQKYDQPKIDAFAEYNFSSGNSGSISSKKSPLKLIKEIKDKNYDFSDTKKDKNILKGIFLKGIEKQEYQVVEKLFEYLYDTDNILTINRHDLHVLYAYLYHKQDKKDLLKDFLSNLLEGKKTLMKEYNSTLPDYKAILVYLKLLDGDFNACDDLLTLSILNDGSGGSKNVIRYVDNSKSELLSPFCKNYIAIVKQSYENRSKDIKVEIDKTSTIVNKETEELYVKKISGKVIKVIDGDEFVVRDDKTRQDLRMKIMSIDAPAKGEYMAEEAYQFTSKEIFGKNVNIDLVAYSAKRDLFGAVVAYTHVKSSYKPKNEPASNVSIGTVIVGETRYLNIEILKNGFAKVKEHIKGRVYLDPQDHAKKNKLGIWSDKK